MLRTVRIAIGLVGLCLLSLTSPTPARAEVIQLFGFSGTSHCPAPQPCLTAPYATQGFSNVGTSGPEELQILPSPYTVIVGPGLAPGGGAINTLTYSLLSGGWFQFHRVTNFQPFITSALYNQGQGSVAIDFARPVSQFGFQVQNFDAGSTTFFLQAFNGLAPLGTFSITGSTTFLGLRAGEEMITRILH